MLEEEIDKLTDSVETVRETSFNEILILDNILSSLFQQKGH